MKSARNFTSLFIIIIIFGNCSDRTSDFSYEGWEKKLASALDRSARLQEKAQSFDQQGVLDNLPHQEKKRFLLSI